MFQGIYVEFGGGEEPAGPVVGVLAAGLHVKVVQAPVLQLLAEVLDTDACRQVQLVRPVQAQHRVEVAR
jgi:hypothetical protein